jgi:hypothetical protein
VSTPVPLRLRPLEIGDILDETFRLYRRHFLFYGALVNQATSANPTDLSSFTQSLTLIGLGTAVNLALLPLLYGSVSLAICDSALGRPVTLRRVLGGAFRRYLHIGAYLGLLFLMAIAFCLFPLWIWIAVGWATVLPVIFIEERGVLAAMSRSWQLVQGRWWRTFLILFLIFVLNYVVSLALEAFLYLGQILLSIFLSQFLALALYEAGVIVVSGLTIPILQIALVLIYFDLRVRKEGLDLFQMAQRVTPAPPALA